MDLGGRPTIGWWYTYPSEKHESQLDGKTSSKPPPRYKLKNNCKPNIQIKPTIEQDTTRHILISSISVKVMHNINHNYIILKQKNTVDMDNSADM